MISKSNSKYIKSLLIKKIRKQEGRFIVEGAKSVIELLNSRYQIDSIFLTTEFYNCYKQLLPNDLQVVHCSEDELNTAGSMVNNNAALAIARTFDNHLLEPLKDTYTLLLDDIRDPGNLGTIIRIADWYGHTQIICSEHTAEFYNPKVIAATMGSFTRVNAYYCDLPSYLDKYKSFLYGAKLSGDNIHHLHFKKEGMILIGNESFGISKTLDYKIDQSLLIPRFGHAESLNAAVATGIILDNIARNLSI